MNEANTVYEDASHNFGMHNKVPTPAHDFKLKSREDDFTEIINPKYLAPG